MSPRLTQLLALATLVASGCDVVLGFDLGAPRDAGALPDDGRPGEAGGEDAGVDAPVVEDARRPVDARPVVGCPAGYGATPVLNGGGRHRLVATPATFAAAATDCADDALDDVNHTHLVVLGGEAERSAVGALLAGTTLWIGLTDQVTEGSFEWVTDEMVAYPPASGSPWAYGQPSGGTGEDCAYLDARADLADGGCATARAYVCECDAYAYDPTN